VFARGFGIAFFLSIPTLIKVLVIVVNDGFCVNTLIKDTGIKAGCFRLPTKTSIWYNLKNRLLAALSLVFVAHFAIVRL